MDDWVIAMLDMGRARQRQFWKPEYVALILDLCRLGMDHSFSTPWS